MKNVLKILQNQYPLRIAHTYLREVLKQDETEKMIQNGILREAKAITTLPCPECGYGNDILYDKANNPYYVCSCENGGRVKLDESAIKRYELSLTAIFEHIAASLQFDIDMVEYIKGHVWRIGIAKRSGKQYEALFYRGNTPIDLNEILINTFTSKIILYFGNSTIQSNKYCYINILDVLQQNDSRFFFSSESIYRFVDNGIKEIYLEPNGDVYISQKKACNLKSDTPEYYYLQYLTDNYGNPCANADIHRYVETEYKKIKHKQRWSYSDDEDQFCRKMKSNVKAKIRNTTLKDIFDSCIIATRIEKDILAYKISNPTA